MSIKTIYDIHQRHVERKKHEHQIYKTIVQDVLKRIDSNDERGKYNTIYRVPCIVYGNTRYNMATATLYIIKKLSKGGFVVFPYEDNILYIDWSIIRHASHTPNNSKNNSQLVRKRVTFDI